MTGELAVTKSQDRKWEVEDAARTLVRAEEIKSDEKLLAETKKYMKEELERRTKILASVNGVDR